MDLPVQSIVEQAVKNQTNALVGNNDVNLNTIVKMSLLTEMEQLDKESIKEVLIKIYDANKAEHYWIHKEYELTYDLSGNIVPTAEASSILSVPTLNGETEKDSNSVDDESEGSKRKLE